MRRWILLLATVWPLLYMVAFCFFFARAWTADDETIFAPWMIALHVLAFVTNVVLIAIYVRDLLRREGVPQEQQAIWGVLMGVLGPLAMLPYWWRYVRSG